VVGTGAISFASFFDDTKMWIDVTIFPAKYAWTLLSDPKGAFLTLGLLAGVFGTIAVIKNDKREAAAKAAAK
jgi:Na+-translocating ferredoxin:NAD+ oxidoreductase RnfE subunit